MQAIDTCIDQPLRFGLCFNGFGQGEHVKMRRNRKQSFGQNLIIRINMNIAGELPIDFQNVEAEILEIAKCGVACAEIIQGEGDALALEIGHEGHDDLGHQHRARLGDLKDQAFDHIRMGAQELPEDVFPFRITDGTGRHIDRQA